MKQRPPLNKLRIYTDAKDHQEKEDAYISVREKEQRFYSNDELRLLPIISPGNPHYKEWKIREISLNLLTNHLNTSPKSRILDLGCGNGWMSHQLAKQGHEVMGVDLNLTELKQASECFSLPQLQFAYGDIQSDLNIGTFDWVIISAALQYFNCPNTLFDQLKKYLSPNGKIIVMDTFFYSEKELLNAQKRSVGYFKKMNSDKMNNYYFHHSDTIFNSIPHRYLYRPKKRSITSKLLGKTTCPFPIVEIG